MAVSAEYVRALWERIGIRRRQCDHSGRRRLGEDCGKYYVAAGAPVATFLVATFVLQGRQMTMNVDLARAVELFAAAYFGDVERVLALLPSCGDPAEDGPPDAPGGVTPLMAAAAGGHEAVVTVLLQCGADPARRDTRGHSAAFYARATHYPHLGARLDTVVDQEKTIR